MFQLIEGDRLCFLTSLGRFFKGYKLLQTSPAEQPGIWAEA